ncbi:hypothetical protein NPIL_78941 [Nephila pilipes]|uniref:Uncharacterized protein n=1 Tax=Nephila pilipes TaxID=299642 RepID=A0A8X6Q5Q0_NEPPI|nr:hypothetical protein NPIL_78941 [Nephila pilipes]
MILFCLILVASSLSYVISSKNTILSSEDRKAIQDRLDKLQVLEDVFNIILKSDKDINASYEETRKEEECLPIGAECHAFSGPNCCSIRTRCFIFDYLEDSGTPKAHWVSHCKEYNAGRWMDAIAKFFG